MDDTTSAQPLTERQAWDAFCESVLEHAAHLMRDSGEIRAYVIGFGWNADKSQPESTWHQTMGDLPGPQVAALARHVVREGARGVALVTELWVSTQPADQPRRYKQASEDPNRGEAILAVLSHVEFGEAPHVAMVTRDPLRVTPWELRADFVGNLFGLAGEPVGRGKA